MCLWTRWMGIIQNWTDFFLQLIMANITTVQCVSEHSNKGTHYLLTLVEETHCLFFFSKIKTCSKDMVHQILLGYTLGYNDWYYCHKNDCVDAITYNILIFASEIIFAYKPIYENTYSYIFHIVRRKLPFRLLDTRYQIWNRKD